jgi:DnaJ like chaperone protein
MSIWGKVIGGMAGFSVGGPLGAILGAALGHAVDKMHSRGEAEAPVWTESAPGSEQNRQIAFTLAVIALSAKMAKSDGVVTRAEIDAFKRLFQIPQNDMVQVGRMFDEARQTADGFEPYAVQIAGLFRDSPAVLEELLHSLFLIARADGELHPNEEAFLSRVAQIFGFTAMQFAAIRARAAAGEAAASSSSDDADPYAVLGISPSATDREIKDTYRRLIRENHPDLLIAKGMPPELVANANRTMSAINAAFESIKRTRGLK